MSPPHLRVSHISNGNLYQDTFDFHLIILLNCGGLILAALPLLAAAAFGSTGDLDFAIWL